MSRSEAKPPMTLAYRSRCVSYSNLNNTRLALFKCLGGGYSSRAIFRIPRGTHTYVSSSQLHTSRKVKELAFFFWSCKYASQRSSSKLALSQWTVWLNGSPERVNQGSPDRLKMNKFAGCPSKRGCGPPAHCDA